MDEAREKILKGAGGIPDREARRLSGGAVLALLGAALVLAVFGSFMLGRYPVSLGQLLGIIFHKLSFLNIEQTWTDTQAIAVLNVRLPAFPPRGRPIRGCSRTPWPRRIFWAPPPERALGRRWPFFLGWAALA